MLWKQTRFTLLNNIHVISVGGWKDIVWYDVQIALVMSSSHALPGWEIRVL